MKTALFKISTQYANSISYDAHHLNSISESKNEDDVVMAIFIILCAT